MRTISVFCLTLLLNISTFSQSKEEDLVVLEQTAEWLEQKLTYNYFNVDDTEWWTNRFDFDPQTQQVTIRNISAENLGAIQDRTHMQRVFSFSDLNAYNIYMEEAKTNSGRLVKGKTIRVGTYQQAKAINQIKNGTVPSTASFLYLSIPKVFEDSVRNYAESIIDKFEKAILLATKIYSTGAFDSNASQLISVMEDDRFIAQNNESMTVTKIFEDALEIEIYDSNEQLIRKAYLKIDPGSQIVKWIGIEGLKPVSSIDLTFGNEYAFELNGENFQIHFENKHELHFLENGEKMVFIRDNSFDKGRPYYR